MCEGDCPTRRRRRRSSVALCASWSAPVGGRSSSAWPRASATRAHRVVTSWRGISTVSAAIGRVDRPASRAGLCATSRSWCWPRPPRARALRTVRPALRRRAVAAAHAVRGRARLVGKTVLVSEGGARRSAGWCEYGEHQWRAAGAAGMDRRCGHLPLPGILPRRRSSSRTSRERDVGLWWRAHGPLARTDRAAYVEGTGELSVMQHEGMPGGGRGQVLAGANPSPSCTASSPAGRTSAATPARSTG